MAEKPDDATWELAGAVRVARNEQGWTLVGGEEDEDGVTLRILVHHPENDELVRRVEVRLPLRAVGSGIDVGLPEVSG